MAKEAKDLEKLFDNLNEEMNIMATQVIDKQKERTERMVSEIVDIQTTRIINSMRKAFKDTTFDEGMKFIASRNSPVESNMLIVLLAEAFPSRACEALSHIDLSGLDKPFGFNLFMI